MKFDIAFRTILVAGLVAVAGCSKTDKDTDFALDNIESADTLYNQALANLEGLSSLTSVGGGLFLLAWLLISLPVVRHDREIAANAAIGS